MRIVTPEQFLDMPPGTVFAFGSPWSFSRLLIKDDSIRGNECWGFWALDPCWIEADGSGQAFDRLEEMRAGASYPMEESTTKYMNYDTDDMECFLVFEAADLDHLKQIMGGGSW